ncbi:MAG: TolC family protein, partial [Gammaproteobacteria bacterium]|nr:TolC family protein [Gammaproteobacteria bacterium]
MALLPTPREAGSPRPLTDSRAGRLRARSIRLAIAGTLCALALPVLASPPVPGDTVESVRTWLIEQNPELRALELEAEAARARVLPAGALPDPSASIALRGLDPGKPWSTPDAGREIDYAVRQRFPLWGKRGLARTAAGQQADAAGLDRNAAARELLADAETAYVRYWHA